MIFAFGFGTELVEWFVVVSMSDCCCTGAARFECAGWSAALTVAPCCLPLFPCLCHQVSFVRCG
jgi:hypothetical protein